MAGPERAVLGPAPPDALVQFACCAAHGRGTMLTLYAANGPAGAEPTAQARTGCVRLTASLPFRWQFLPVADERDGSIKWAWRAFTHTGKLALYSDRLFDSLTDCLSDAREHGYSV